MDIVEPSKIKSVISGVLFNPDEGYVTDADGNFYKLSEYSIESDKTQN